MLDRILIVVVLIVIIATFCLVLYLMAEHPCARGAEMSFAC